MVARPGQGPPAAEHWNEWIPFALSLRRGETFVFLPLQEGGYERDGDLQREIPKQVRDDTLFLIMLNLGLVKIRLVSASHLMSLYQP